MREEDDQGEKLWCRLLPHPGTSKATTALLSLLVGKRNKPFYPPHQPVIESRLSPEGSMTMGEETPKRADSWRCLQATLSSSCRNISFILKWHLGRTARYPLHYFCLFSWIRDVTSELARKPQWQRCWDSRGTVLPCPPILQGLEFLIKWI